MQTAYDLEWAFEPGSAAAVDCAFSSVGLAPAVVSNGLLPGACVLFCSGTGLDCTGDCVIWVTSSVTRQGFADYL